MEGPTVLESTPFPLVLSVVPSCTVGSIVRGTYVYHCCIFPDILGEFTLQSL